MGTRCDDLIKDHLIRVPYNGYKKFHTVNKRLLVVKKIKQMKKISLLFIACIAIILPSCGDMDDCCVNTDIDTQVIIVKSGFLSISSSELTENTYPIYVYKAGYNSETVTVNLSVDETILSDYNSEHATSYVALPASYYTVGNGVALTSKHYADFIPVTFNTAAIRQDYNGNEYVLPLVISGVPEEKTNENNYILILLEND